MVDRMGGERASATKDGARIGHVLIKRFVLCEGCAYRPFGIFPRARFWLLVSFTRSVTGAAGGKPDGLQ